MKHIILSLSFLSTPAMAHSGHVGELAGHSHLVGWGLLIGVGIAAAVFARLSEKKQDEEAVEADDLEDEIEGETA